MSYTIEEKRNPTYTESNSNITTSYEYVIISDSAMTLKEAQAAMVSWSRTHQKDWQNRKLSGISLTSDESGLNDVWTFRADYSTRQKDNNKESKQYPEQEGCVSESFSTSGGSGHITQAYGETRVAIGSNTIPDMQGGVGWNGDSFEGVDCVRPAYEMSISKRFAHDNITASVRKYICSLTGCTNNAAWRGFAAGEVLFLGCSGQTSTEYDGDTVTIDGVTYQQAKNYWDLTFNFRCSPNYPNNTFPIAGTYITKAGHDYVWVLRQTQDDSTSGMTIQTPIGVYCDSVYMSANFANLPIPTTE